MILYFSATGNCKYVATRLTLRMSLRNFGTEAMKSASIRCPMPNSALHTPESRRTRGANTTPTGECHLFSSLIYTKKKASI